MKVWQFDADLDWVRGTEGEDEPFAESSRDEFRSSLVFADTNRGDLFSTSASATAKFLPYPAEDWSHVRGTVLLPPDLTSYATNGRQFLVVRGSRCEAVGRFTQISKAPELKR